MKIGIVTFWWSKDNYGQILQCYALQKYLRNLGHDAYLIRYLGNNLEDSLNSYKRIPPLYIKCLKILNPIKVACFIKRKLEHLFNPNFSKELPRFFDEFQKRNLHFSDRVYHSYAELKAAPPQADCYIVGSDQVWNMHWFGEKLEDYQKALHAYFLDFGNPQIKRMSYAASWSCDSLPENVYQEIQPLLAKFNYVSVREFSGIQMCEKCGCKNAEHVLDPTMLLDAESYRSLYRQVENSKVVEKKFLLLYLLGTSCDLDINKVYRFAKTHHLEVVYVSGRQSFKKSKKNFPKKLSFLWGGILNIKVCLIY